MFFSEKLNLQKVSSEHSNYLQKEGFSKHGFYCDLPNRVGIAFEYFGTEL